MNKQNLFWDNEQGFLSLLFFKQNLQWTNKTFSETNNTFYETINKQNLFWDNEQGFLFSETNNTFYETMNKQNLFWDNEQGFLSLLFFKKINN
jgi:hypothetical protein